MERGQNARNPTMTLRTARYEARRRDTWTCKTRGARTALRSTFRRKNVISHFRRGWRNFRAITDALAKPTERIIPSQTSTGEKIHPQAILGSTCISDWVFANVCDYLAYLAHGVLSCTARRGFVRNAG